MKSIFRYLNQEIETEVRRFSGGGAYATVPVEWAGKNVLWKLKKDEKYDAKQTFIVKKKTNSGAYVQVSSRYADQTIYMKLIEDAHT